MESESKPDKPKDLSGLISRKPKKNYDLKLFLRLPVEVEEFVMEKYELPLERFLEQIITDGICKKTGLAQFKMFCHIHG